MPQYDEGFCSKYIFEHCMPSRIWCYNRKLCVANGPGQCKKKPFACDVYVESLLLECVRVIKMTELNSVRLELVHPKDPNLSGASAVVIIAESHLALSVESRLVRRGSVGAHTWSEENVLRLVIDSCKEYTADSIADFFCAILHPRVVKIWVETDRLTYHRKKKYGMLGSKGIKDLSSLFFVGMIRHVKSFVMRRQDDK